MKVDSPGQQSKRTTRNALMNILFMPGLGSLWAGRWLTGIGQILIAIIGSAMMFVWLYKIMVQYYGLMFGDVKPEAVGWIGETGGVLLGISWLWAVVTSLSLFREAARQDSESRGNSRFSASGSVAPPVLSAPGTILQWHRNGEVISRVYEFKDFPAAMNFVNAVAQIAEQAQHHPDVDIRWNKVRLALTTHDAGGLTEKDFAMARQCDQLAGR